MVGFAAITFVLMVLPAPAMADTVEIHDDSKVLNAAEVRTAASALPDPVRIYTVTRPADNAAFTTWLESKGDPSSDVILIGLNARTHQLVGRAGDRSGMTQSGLDRAVAVFEAESKTAHGDETSALTAMLGSLETSLRQAGVTTRPDARPTTWSTTLGSGGKVHVTVTHSRNPFHGLVVSAIGSLVCIASLSLIAFLRRRGRLAVPPAGHPAPSARPGYGSPAGTGYGPPPGPGYGPPAGQGYGPPAGPGYGPPPGPGYGPPAGQGYAPPAGPGYAPAAGQGYGSPAGPGQGPGASGPADPPPADPPSGNPPYPSW